MSHGPQPHRGYPASEPETSRPYCLQAILRMCGLRPTRQRVQLARCLVGRDRHFTAEQLHRKVADEGARMSLATVYNALRQFQQIGLVRELPIDGMRSVFDTNTSSHHHFYLIEDDTILDIPHGSVSLVQMPELPPGYEVGRVEVIVRLQRR